MEEILKQIEVGHNPQESFVKMDKNRDVKNRVRSQVMHLNPPMEKEAPEEIRNRKTEAPKNIRKTIDLFPSSWGKDSPTDPRQWITLRG